MTQPWEPIGKASRSDSTIFQGFKGVYNGKSYTITGLDIIDGTADAGIGFISALVGETTVLKNIEFASVTINTPDARNVGVAVGLLSQGATIENVKVLGGSVAGKDGTGGIVGRMIMTGTVKDVENHATVSGTGFNIGGIVGAAYYDQEKSRTSESSLVPFIIQDAQNHGMVSGNGVTGGIAGLARTVDIKNVTNRGNVTVQNAGVGGIAGEFGHGGVLDTAYNYADITAGTGTGTGGIAGWIRYNDTGNYNKTINSTVKNAHNTGSITTSGAVTGVGGVVGMIYWAGTIEDSSNNASITNATGNMTGGIIGSIQWLSDGNAQASNIILINRNEVKAQSTVTSSGGNKHSFIGHVVMPELQEPHPEITFSGNIDSGTDTGIPVI